MRNRLFFAPCLALLLTASAVFAQDTKKPTAAEFKARQHGKEAQAAGLNAEVLGNLDIAFQKAVADGQVSGVIGLLYRNGHRGYYEAFGKRDIATNSPMPKNALFRIYSMTKPITAVAAMSIWEEGKFKLDDPIAEHLPEWADAFVMEKGEKIPVKKPLTARHLLTHSSGLTYGRVGLTSTDGVTLAMFSKKLAARPLKFQPGTSYNYGYSLDVLGAYLEAIEGQSLDAIFRERIFDQIGMDDTEFWVRNQEDLGRIAQVYSKRKSGELFPSRSSRELLDKPQRMMGGQGLVSTTEDYAMFCEMMAKGGTLDGKRVLKKKTINLMLENHLKDIGKSYGLGGAVDGKGGYVWGGAAGTGFWVNRKNESYGVYMIQAMGYKPKTYGVFKNLAKKAVTTAE